jgi:hypothetical protein
MLFKAGKRQILSLAMGIIILAGTSSLAGCITLSPGPSTQDNAGSTSTSAEPSQGMKVASLKGATLVDTGIFSKVAVNTVLDRDSSLVSYSSSGNSVKGQTATGWGVFGDASSSGAGLVGHSVNGNGVEGKSIIGPGVTGSSTDGSGVRGGSANSSGVFGQNTKNGNWGTLGEEGCGVYAQNANKNWASLGGKEDSITAGHLSPTGYAGNFIGNVKITGTLTKGGGTFKIDHPQDPANKYLSHSFVESPDMMNVYNGNITLDANGEAIVALPAYFESLNRDFRYQLTCIGGYAPVYVAEKVKDNSFKIAGGKAGIEVSWQVTGVRQDAFAKAHPVIVEQEKPSNEKGFYLHPVELGQPAEKGIK